MQKWIMLMMLVALQGCSSNDQVNAFDDSLYSGKPVDSLTANEAPKTEKEAITRGDKALANKKMDLALYEYIRSLEFDDLEYADKTLITIGDIHQARGNVPLAEKSYLRAVEENPNNVTALENLGVLYSRNGNLPDGQVYFYRAINADQIRLKQNEPFARHKESITVEQVEALKLDPQSPLHAYIGLGILADVNQEGELAQEYYKKALAIDPFSTLAKLNLGYSYYMQGNDKQALFYTKQVVALQPQNKRATNNLALIYIRQGQVTNALNVFMRVMPDYEALNNVGYLLMLNQHQEESVPYFKRAIDKNPSYYPLANDNLSRALSEIRAKNPT
ncbi:tetratricopeptide repeat protein [Vibrio rumoiensis]|uniref:Tetratricopeptide repeat protein n=1 Tax=Vibrio rumoiensis TaxID=76258 RepID=A0ABW7IWF5_9VIBR|nr:tetratricopeptide repeat protein [Vibrio rumoiensis]